MAKTLNEVVMNIPEILVYSEKWFFQMQWKNELLFGIIGFILMFCGKTGFSLHSSLPVYFIEEPFTL